MNRRQLKSNAKFVLKKYFVMLFIVSLVMALLSGNTGRGRGEASWRGNSTHSAQWIQYEIDDMANDISDRFDKHGDRFDEFGDRFDGHGKDMINMGSNFIQRSVDGLPVGKLLTVVLGTGIAMLTALILILAVGFSFFVAFPIKVGGSRIFIETADGAHEPKLGKLAFAFTSGHYMNSVKAGFLTSLYSFLWGLLFVIPGIVKGYSYSMVPYILADNPSLSATEAINLSKEMTNGHKWELFVLDLSFIGWYILGALAFGIGVFLVHPYKDATWAQAYLSLRERFLVAPVETAPAMYDAREINGN